MLHGGSAECRKKRKDYAGGDGLQEALDRPMASRPLKGVWGEGEGVVA